MARCSHAACVQQSLWWIALAYTAFDDTASRPLPRSLDPPPDESIIGFVLHLAHRQEIPPASVADLTGLNTGHRSCTSALCLAVHVVPTAGHAFTHATRLTRRDRQPVSSVRWAIATQPPNPARPQPLGQRHLLRSVAVHPVHRVSHWANRYAEDRLRW